MSIQVKLNTVDITGSVLFPTLNITQMLTSQVDTASFQVRTVAVAFDDDVEVYDGTTKIFGGKITQIESVADSGKSQIYDISCVDHSFEFDRMLASKTYISKTVKEIIEDLVSSYASGFTANNVSSNFNTTKIVFNQVPLTQCLKRLADLVNCDWYIDPDKDVHFFPKFTSVAPFDLTDTSGKYVYKSLKRLVDGTQVVNRVKVRGGEYDGAEFTDTITVVGNETKSFKLPYRFADLKISITGDSPAEQSVGIDFIDSFATRDVLYNFQDAMIHFEAPLSDGDEIVFTGKPKIRTFAVAEDADSIAKYGRIEKLIRENDIASNLVARKRATGELMAYNEPIIDARFKTYTAGLRTGMVLKVKSTNRDFDDNLLIKRVSFLPRTPEEFEYQVECVSTKRWGLVEILQKLLATETLSIDEAEVSEEIVVANEGLQIMEEIVSVKPVIADEDIKVAENYLKDAFTPEWVLSPYVPTEQTDVKRPMRLNYSSYLY